MSESIELVSVTNIGATPKLEPANALGGRLKALLRRDGVMEDSVEDLFSTLETICGVFSREIGVPRGSSLNRLRRRMLAQFVVMISNVWFDATGEDAAPMMIIGDGSDHELASENPYEIIFDIVEEMQRSSLASHVARVS